MEDDKKNEIDIILSYKNYNGTYHNHKENMAWLATALYLAGISGLTGFVLGKSFKCYEIFWLIVLILAACALTFLFIRSQFKNKRIASARVDRCDKFLSTLYDGKRTSDDWTSEVHKSLTENIPPKSLPPYITRWYSYTAIVGFSMFSIFICLWPAVRFCFLHILGGLFCSCC